MKKNFKLVVSIEQDRTTTEEIYVAHDNLIEKAIKEKIYERVAMEVADYINKEDKYIFDIDYARQSGLEGKKVSEIKDDVITKVGKFDISEYESIEDFLNESIKDFEVLTSKDGLKEGLELMLSKNIRSVIVPLVKSWIIQNKESIVKELKSLSREQLIECIDSVLSAEKVTVKEIKENVETQERVEEIVPKKNVEYIGFEDSKIVKNYTEEELLDIMYDKIAESPFTYIRLYDENNLAKLYEQGNKLLSEKGK